MARGTHVVGVLPAIRRAVALAAADPRWGGLLLAGILARTGGSYEWDFPVGDELRRRWLRTATDIGDHDLEVRLGAPTVRVSLEQLRGRDTQVTRVVIGFNIHHDEDEGLRAARADVGRSGS
ncbi:hypothetical protein [Cellulomonas sp. URHB0016]